MNTKSKSGICRYGPSRLGIVKGVHVSTADRGVPIETQYFHPGLSPNPKPSLNVTQGPELLSGSSFQGPPSRVYTAYMPNERVTTAEECFLFGTVPAPNFLTHNRVWYSRAEWDPRAVRRCCCKAYQSVLGLIRSHLCAPALAVPGSKSSSRKGEPMSASEADCACVGLTWRWPSYLCFCNLDGVSKRWVQPW